MAGTALAVLGGIGSFSAVRQEAIQHSFRPSAAWTVPAGIDTAIIALVLADLLFTSMEMEMPVLQVAATILSATTVWLNIEAGRGDLVASGMHAVMPSLLILWTKGVRQAIRRATGIASGTVRDKIPRMRWVLAPRSTVVLWRFMILWQEVSYARALDAERRRRHGLALLRARYGRAWAKQTPADLVWMLRSGVWPNEAHARILELVDQRGDDTHDQQARGVEASGDGVDPDPSGSSSKPQRRPRRPGRPRGARGRGKKHDDGERMVGLSDEQILADMPMRWESVPARARVVRIYGVGSERASRLMDAFGAHLRTGADAVERAESAGSADLPADDLAQEGV